MRRIILSAHTESYYSKYSRLVNNEQSGPKLRALLKQLNGEVESYLLKRKPEQKKSVSVPHKKKLEIIINEQQNNEDIIKRMKYELNTTNKRLIKFEEQNYQIDLEKKMSQVQDNIKALYKAIDQNNKINYRQGKEILQIEESDGMNPNQLEKYFIIKISKHIDRAISDQKQRNMVYLKQIEQMDRDNKQLEQCNGQIDTKLQKYSGQQFENQDLLELQQKLILQINNSERTKRIIEDKYQIDKKMIRQDIQYKTNRIQQLDNSINKLNLEIIQLKNKNLQLTEMQKPKASAKQHSQSFSYKTNADKSYVDDLQEILEQPYEQTLLTEVFQDKTQISTKIEYNSNIQILEKQYSDVNNQDENKNTNNNNSNNNNDNNNVKDENDIYEDIQEDIDQDNLAANNSQNIIKKDSIDSEKLNKEY